MGGKNYIPTSYAQLESWLTAFLNYLESHMSSFGIDPTNYASLYTQYLEFKAANQKADSNNAGAADRIDRKERAEAITHAVREFVNKYLRYNDSVTDYDRVQMGLTVSDTKPTPSPVPSTIPGVDAATPGPGIVELHYYDSTNAESKNRKKPDGVHGLEILWALLDEPPLDDWGKLVHSAFSTASPHRLTFSGPERGKRLYFALRWENTRGQKGPLSIIYEVIVP